MEVRPEDQLESGEIVPEPVQIKDVKMSAERFNTQNLQEELQRSMQEIMNATEKEAVNDTMDNIKKLVEDIPYLQIPSEKEEEPQEEEVYQHIETDEEIDNSLKSNFQEMLVDEDGQMSLYMQGGRVAEPQVSGQMSIEDVLAEWEKTKRAAEAALQEAEQRKLESAKARALQEAEELLGRLADVIPMLDSGLTPKDLLDQKYLSKDGQPNDNAVSMVTNMNQFLQQEIDRLNAENAALHEQIGTLNRANREEKVRHEQAEQQLQAKLDRIEHWLPDTQTLIRWGEYCRDMGIPESGAREIIAMKPLYVSGELRAPEYSRRFDVSNTEIRLQRDPNGPGGFQLLIDRQPAHTWFRQRYVELMTRLGYPVRPERPVIRRHTIKR